MRKVSVIITDSIAKAIFGGWLMEVCTFITPLHIGVIEMTTLSKEKMKEIVAKAPEGATHYERTSDLYYKYIGRVFYTCVASKWVVSIYTGPKDHSDPSVDFIELPNEEDKGILVKPPIGLKPKHIYEHDCKLQRKQDIREAIARYIEAEKDIPVKWLDELKDLFDIKPFVLEAEDKPTQVIETTTESDEGWIEWGKHEIPDIDQAQYIEYDYSDGSKRAGTVNDWDWYDTDYVVSRYRFITKEQADNFVKVG